ncbi:MAG: electron transfer flavoprotein subunit alpha/FixB family protein [Bacteroidia bacterium]
MPVLVYAENWDGQFKKATFEAVSYASQIAEKSGDSVTAVSIGEVSEETLKSIGKYGADKILVAGNEKLKQYRVSSYAAAIVQAAEKEGAKLVIFASTFNGKSLAPRVAARMKAAAITGVIDIPQMDGDFIVKKPVFSGKGFSHVKMESDKKVLALLVNSVKAQENPKEASIEKFNVEIDDAAVNTEIKEVKKSTGKLSLTEAEVVVSGGRGMKSPDNWGPLEELAETLGAATACSKPVSDMDWRPHSEHVGQTGLAIRPNLYIAIGISGAIQHLAGVNASKVIAVINKDPEAPFFKAADYGIVGDAFEVLPKLIKAAKELKAS